MAGGMQGRGRAEAGSQPPYRGLTQRPVPRAPTGGARGLPNSSQPSASHPSFLSGLPLPRSLCATCSPPWSSAGCPPPAPPPRSPGSSGEPAELSWGGGGGGGAAGLSPPRVASSCWSRGSSRAAISPPRGRRTQQRVWAPMAEGSVPRLAQDQGCKPVPTPSRSRADEVSTSQARWAPSPRGTGAATAGGEGPAQGRLASERDRRRRCSR